ncbi:DUF3068 domain-containing protein [Actinomycetes bacterium KLBMP 9797]
MKRTVGGAALFGGGLFLIVVAAALALVITPLLSKLPFDLDPPETTLEAPDATFVQAKMVNGAPQIGVERGALLATTGIQPDLGASAELTGALANEAVVWNVYQNIRRAGTDELISASESRIALDRKTGAAADWSGQCFTDQEDQPCQGGNISYGGQLYAFPFGTEKTTYQYFDSVLKTTLPLAYRGTDTVEGLTAYRFEQAVPEQPATMDSELVSTLLAIFAPGATSGTVQYRASRTIWVEPVTGSIVDYREQQHRVLVSDTGVRTTLLDAEFRYTPETRATVADKAGAGRSSLRLLGWYAPIGLTVLGVALLVFGFFLVRPARRTAPAPAHRAPTPAPA